MAEQPTRLEQQVEHDLNVVHRRLRRMAELVGKNLEDAVTAVATRDHRLAYQVVLLDNRIDSLERHIDRLGQEFLVRHMPVAAQLRFIIAAIKVNAELERVGDYAEAIARRAVSLRAQDARPEVPRILEMAKVAFQMFRQAVESFLLGDPDLALRVLDVDRQVDEMNAGLFSSLAHPASGEEDLTARFVLLGVLNRIERVADRACNVAEEAIFAARGEVLRHIPRHDIRVLFLSEENTSRGQMAEALGRQLAPVQFLFSSAGINPGQTIDPGALRFMANQQLDLARQRPKSLADVGRVQDFDVVVTLSHRAEEECPQVPYGALHLDWEIPDPSRATGTPNEETTYRQVYDDLRTRIKALIDGLLGAHAELEDDA